MGVRLALAFHMSPGRIAGREREILTAIVETFIATGEPVGSRTLARGSREGLSAATIRNVMADLADAGYLDQPHTSAGRVPTAEAYRYYVEQLSGETHLSQRNSGTDGTVPVPSSNHIPKRTAGQHRLHSSVRH